ncbi:NAD(P)/FAD-dependent oxidoreductase [Pseudooceanicola sp. C21-150M6]|uniref:NAD(P)/FAD-dependent oxidoreductase n=1 Tax=Pseudooceanicola sp. C21-150M6 TaxID=3434355 RepID=UPI003D7F5C6B
MLPETVDVLVIGSGPAGLSAARRLRELGVDRVHVLEREPVAGGIPRHCAHSPYGMREYRRVMFGPAYARANVAAAEAAGVQVHVMATVTRLMPGGVVEIALPSGLQTVSARAVVLAMGARESTRAARLIGGTKPGGVINTGALQGLVHLNRQRPFERPMVLGTELVSFSALLTCRQAGIRPVAMVEPGARVVARWPAGLLPRVLAIPLRLGTEVVAVHGRDRVTGVTLRHSGGTEEIACDGLIVTGGFRPENALIRDSHLALDPATLGPEVDQYARTSDPAYFACGNLLRGIETAGWCWREGHRVAEAVAAGLAGDLPEDMGRPVAVTTGGAGVLRYTLPQRLAPGSSAPALPDLQLRVTRDYSGPLVVAGQDGHLSARPERRVLRPLPRS